MKSLSICVIFCPVLSLAWIPNSRSFVSRRTPLQVSNSDTEDQPCWQDIWSYDCAMSKAYSASFVPADWIRKLPCALGLADCNTPDELKRPSVSGSGVEDVDVMSFLNIKRANPVQKE
mmetsp:Transcript_16401/g.20041  ORF Transcript_16401/g.20041 Transcript_16401/m.20041 type:complete len:118 (+) Transcript_16401:136-489(+)